MALSGIVEVQVRNVIQSDEDFLKVFEPKMDIAVTKAELKDLLARHGAEACRPLTRGLSLDINECPDSAHFMIVELSKLWEIVGHNISLCTHFAIMRSTQAAKAAGVVGAFVGGAAGAIAGGLGGAVSGAAAGYGAGKAHAADVADGIKCFYGVHAATCRSCVEEFETTKQKDHPEYGLCQNCLCQGNANHKPISNDPAPQRGSQQLGIHPPGSRVEYFSKGRGGWIPTTVKGFDAQNGMFSLATDDGGLVPQAPLEKVRTPQASLQGQSQFPRDETFQQYPIHQLPTLLGSRVDYFSKGRGGWIPTTVKGFDAQSGTFSLATDDGGLVPQAPPEKVRWSASAPRDKVRG